MTAATMPQQSGYPCSPHCEGYLRELARRNEVAEWMTARGYATGHGDTISDMLVELEGHAKARGVAEHYGERP